MSAMMVAAFALVVGASPSMHAIDFDARSHDVRLAQFGPMTKKPAAPVPQRTAAPNTRQNVERRGAQPQPGGAFGGMHKQGDPRPRVTQTR